MDDRGKSWMALPRFEDQYMNGVDYFLDKAFERAAIGKEILCPCKNCCNRYWEKRDNVREHLIVDGFMKGYSEWVFHGEGYTSRINEEHIFNDGGLNPLDDMDGILHDAYRNIAEEAANT